MARVPEASETAELWRQRFLALNGMLILSLCAMALALLAPPGRSPSLTALQHWFLVGVLFLGMFYGLANFAWHSRLEEKEKKRILDRLQDGSPRGSGVAVVALVVFGDIAQTIFDSIISFLNSVATGIEAFFGTIFQSFANLVSQILNAPVEAVNASFQQLSNWTAQFGPFAPIITILVTAATIVIIVFLVWVVIRLSVSEGEQTAGEVEEGI